MNRLALHDGNKPVHRFAVVLCFRDSEEYLKYLFEELATLERCYAAKFIYYIYENDSIDDTPKLCEEFLRTRSGRFWSESLTQDNTTTGTGFTRIARMAQVRNRLLYLCRDYILNSDWCLFIDGDIYWEQRILADMFAVKPAVNDIIMLTCNTIEIHKKQECDVDVPDDVLFVTSQHYYDTFAYIGMNDCIIYPHCNWKHCNKKECIDARSQHGHPCDDIEFVRSAWAGFVLIQSEVFANKDVHWKTLRVTDGISLCEHIYLCDAIKAATGKKIARLTNVQPFRRAD